MDVNMLKCVCYDGIILQSCVVDANTVSSTCCVSNYIADDCIVEAKASFQVIVALCYDLCLCLVFVFVFVFVIV